MLAALSASLPAIVLALLLLWRRRLGAGLRAGLLEAAVFWGVLLVAISEALSAARSLDRPQLAGAWAVAGLACLLGPRRTPPARQADASLGASRPALALALRALVVVLLLTLVGTLLCALVSPPNNWDSMTYHLARVMHWVQQGSVEHFPTWNLRQIFTGPWAELAILHGFVLSGGDRLANLVQWLAMLGSLAGVSLVARELGAGVRGQFFAAVFAGTLPMGILQASSTQNDYVTSFWLVCTAWFLLRPWSEGAAASAAFAASSLGLALLTKGTAFVYAPPLVAVLGGLQLRRHRLVAARALALALPVALALNAPHLVRNWRVFGHPLGPLQELPRYRVNGPSLVFTASNLLRNAALQLRTADAGFDRSLERAVLALHEWIGARADDRRSTWSSIGFRLEVAERHEDHAACGLHFLLLLACAAALPPLSRGPALGVRLAYLAALAGATLLFCVLLKWQPWNGRLHLPLFVLAAAPVGVTLDAWKRARLAEAALLIVAICSLDLVVLNELRPLLGPASVFTSPRLDQYFAARPELQAGFERELGSLPAQACDRLGLVSGQNEFEYLVWILARSRYGRFPRIEHVDVSNPSARLGKRAPFAGFRPCITIALDGTKSAWRWSEPGR